MTRKVYTGPIVDVTFDRALCIHSARCISELPEVFDVFERPWVNLSEIDTEAAAERVRWQVRRCPPGALQIQEH
ncbi:MAG: (4Fe-4S)-binding protein [Promicromonosporaceae bacterium]|nr:(4Fe-4S)-binding protein [Promicromonosporaceae bacterium]